MERLEDGSLYLAAGERFPFICPKCGEAKEYKEELDGRMLRCDNCQHEAHSEDFKGAEFSFKTRPQ